jgi:SAM-dependent methyltransferase
MPLKPLGTARQQPRFRVSRPGAQQIVSDVVISSYFQELLGPRVEGSLLNIGAGGISNELRHADAFPSASEYHTFEMPGAPLNATYTGSVNDMHAVPTARYDWAISTAMLEHLEDPWSAAREMQRVVRPGGHLYVSTPFSQIVHYEPRYRDFWRFTPMGLGALFTECAVIEVEAWGDNPAKPNGFAVLLERMATNQKPAYKPAASYWLEFPNEQPWMIFQDEPNTSFDWPLYQLLIEPMNLAHQLHNVRNDFGLRAKLPAAYDDVMRAFKHQYARYIGTLGMRGGTPYFSNLTSK